MGCIWVCSLTCVYGLQGDCLFVLLLPLQACPWLASYSCIGSAHGLVRAACRVLSHACCLQQLCVLCMLAMVALPALLVAPPCMPGELFNPLRPTAGGRVLTALLRTACRPVGCIVGVASRSHAVSFFCTCVCCLLYSAYACIAWPMDCGYSDVSHRLLGMLMEFVVPLAWPQCQGCSHRWCEACGPTM